MLLPNRNQAEKELFLLEIQMLKQQVCNLCAAYVAVHIWNSPYPIIGKGFGKPGVHGARRERSLEQAS